MEEIKEYVQLTIDDYMKYKEDLRQELANLANGFIRTGYYLKKIRDAEAYRNDGYETIYEFAEKEYGITRSVASRFMKINDKFSEGGYSLELMEQYKGLGSSRLTEMLTLSVEDHEMITNITRIEDIRELKRFEKQGPEGEPTQHEELFRNFFVGKEKELNAVMKYKDIKDVAEIVNPSGNRTWKYRMLFMAMKEYDKGISIKDLLKPVPVTITWESFVEQCRGIFTYDPEEEGTPYEQNYGKEQEPLDLIQSDGDFDTSVKKEKTDKSVTKSKPKAKNKEKAGPGREENKDSATTDSMCKRGKTSNLFKSETDLEETEKVSTQEEDAAQDEPEVCTGDVEEENTVSNPEKDVCDIAQTTDLFNTEAISSVKQDVWKNDDGIPYLKVGIKYAEPIKSGKKRFSVRYDDRNYQEGDEYELVFTNGIGILSEPHIHIRITYVLREFTGLKAGYVVFGYEVII